MNGRMHGYGPPPPPNDPGGCRHGGKPSEILACVRCRLALQTRETLEKGLDRIAWILVAIVFPELEWLPRGMAAAILDVEPAQVSRLVDQDRLEGQKDKRSRDDGRGPLRISRRSVFRQLAGIDG
jgi:hypothetical protein